MREITEEVAKEIYERLRTQDITTWDIEPANTYIDGKRLIFEGTSEEDAERIWFALMSVIAS